MLFIVLHILGLSFYGFESSIVQKKSLFTVWMTNLKEANSDLQVNHLLDSDLSTTL